MSDQGTPTSPRSSTSIPAINTIKKESRHAKVIPSKCTDQGGLTKVGWANPEEDEEDEDGHRVLKGDIIHTPEDCTRH